MKHMKEAKTENIGRGIYVKTNKGRLAAIVVKENKITWWVRLPDNNIIKRHKVKHAA